MSVLTPAANAAVAVSGPPLLTAEEFVERYPNHRVELVDGIVKELPMPKFPHGWLCALISRLLGNHVEDVRFGWVVSHDTFVLVKRDPDLVRGPDTAVYSFARLPAGPIPEDPRDIMPELVVEVKSPSDRWKDIYVKIAEYLDAGVQVVVVLDAATQTAQICRGNSQYETLHRPDTLTVADVLPGFAVPLARLFP